jgi:steroid delta-isomerase-like uncharacterized protein
MPLSTMNKDIVRQWVDDVMNQSQLTRIDELAASTYAIEYRQLHQRLRETFADFHLTLTETIAEGNKVAVCWEAAAVHQGNWRGVPANVKPVTWRGISVYFLEDGKITDEITSWNRLDMYEQLVGLPEWFLH